MLAFFTATALAATALLTAIEPSLARTLAAWAAITTITAATVGAYLAWGIA
ncbi:hypothetical protein [Streptomyces klenkii]|uniref:hypothetical protein n=1 Tax=Streptomyces klenkii TaxID=1420899 RepID=UPI001319D254|nr:hypothetical protein [Streptomyces klenkii]